MANNIVLNSGAGGSTLATEQNGTAEHYQKIKITDGTAAGFTNLAAVTSGSALKVDGSAAVQPINDNGANLHVQGAAASGAAKAGNPVQAGGVFNTTQPTVTTGQAVELQATARGALIIATGTDALTITPSGTQTVSGTVTANQGTPTNWAVNEAQVAGTNTLTGNGTTGAGSQRVTIASDNTAFSVNAIQSTAAASTAGWPTIAGNVAVSTAAWTSGTAQNTAVTVTVTNYSTVALGLNATSTMTGGVLTFEADDGSGTWFPIIGSQSDDTATNTTFTLSVVNKLWQFNVAGFTQFRVRLSTAISGTGTANIRVLASAASAVPVVQASGSLPTGANVIGALSANQTVNVAQWNGATAAISVAGAPAVGGDTADAATDAGNPIKQGFKAVTSRPAVYTTAQRANAYADEYGELFVRTADQAHAAVNWTAIHLPIVNTQATASKAAGAAGVRNICTSITGIFAAGTTAPAAFNGQLNLIDGASGGTTYLWRVTCSIPATAGVTGGVVLPRCWFVGTAATAMTLEFNAAGGANTFESVSMAGITLAE